MNSKQNIKDFIRYFEKFDTFKTDDISCYYRSDKPDLKQSTINWKVYKLVQNSIIRRIGRGIFTLGKQTVYTPKDDKLIRTIARSISKQFPYMEFCIWDTAILNTLSQHLSDKNFILIEVEKDVAESVFLFLQDKTKKVFFNPSAEIIDNYMFQSGTKPYVVKYMVSESPIIKLNNYSTASIEKILVDVYCDDKLFYAYQGHELTELYKNAFEQYTINLTKLLRYAVRRGKKEEITNMLNKLSAIRKINDNNLKK